MTPLLFLALAVAGGAGAALRFLVDGLIRGVAARLPWATITINLSGSFLLGLLVGLASHGRIPDAVEVVLGTGLLGGYTTFSTASIETVRLAQERRWAAVFLNGVLQLVVAVALAAAGLALGAA